MKTLTVEDDLYAALEEEVHRVGRTVGEVVSEVLSSWLTEAQLDEEERAEIEATRIEALLGRDRDKIQILGDIIEPIDVEWEAESNLDWSGNLDRLNARE